MDSTPDNHDDALAIIRFGEELAWARAWIREDLDDAVILAVPQLFLSQSTTLALAEGTPYQQAFASSDITVRSGTVGEMLGVFLVLHAGFSLYVTGEAEIKNFAVLVPGKGVLPVMQDVVRRAAEMLR